MKALVEIKTDQKIEAISIVNAGTEKYNATVNEILKCKNFEVVDVQVFEGHPEFEKEYASMEVAEETYISTLIDLEPNEIENFLSYKNEILAKAMKSISNRNLDILAASEHGNEAYVYFNEP